MDGWQPIAVAPRNGWIETTGTGGTGGVHIFDSVGWWEDETGDYTVEASFNPNGHFGLTHWRYLPAGHVISDYEGTDRFAEPIARPPASS